MGTPDIVLTIDQEPEISLTVTEAKLKPEQSKTVTPSYDAQTVLPDAGMTLGSVTVEPIPEPTDRLTITENGSYNVARIGGVDVDVPIPPGYVHPEGTLAIVENGTGIDVREKASVDVAVPIPEMPEEYAIGGSIVDQTATGYHIGDGVTEIANNRINYMSSLVNLYLPNSLLHIRNQSLAQSTNLILRDFPASLQTIESLAFFQCLSLTELHFHGTLKSIAANAFFGCINLRNIYVPWSEGEVANAPWGATNATIHYNWEG